MADGYVLTDAAIRQLRADHNELRGLLRSATGDLRKSKNSEQKIDGYKFLNNSSETVPAYGVMGITAGTFDSDFYFTCGQPDTTFRRFYLINGPIDVEAGKYGWAQKPNQTNKVLFRTASGTPAAGECWGPKPSQWTLEKNYYGFTILGGADTTLGQVLCQQHVVNTIIGKTDSSHAKSASGTISVYAGTLGSESDTTINITAYNRFAAVSTTKWVQADWIGGGWNLSAAEC